MLVLASTSPRRRRLLSEAGFRFEIIAPRVQEKIDLPLTVRELTSWNAIRKGISIARAHPGKVVIAADTLVALDGAIIGKPNDLSEGRAILQRLSGRTHDVCSAVFIGTITRWTAFTEQSHVRFRRLTERKINSYLAKVNALDKAGAYAAQGEGAEIIREITGSFTNVVGLPMETTIAILRNFGITPQERQA